MNKHELVWKEVVVLALVAIFSFSFYNGADDPTLHVGFGLLSIVFYIINRAEENKIKKKKLHDYFHHTSSYFALSTLCFVLSYALLAYSNFILLVLAIGVILFSVGFMRLLFSRIK